MSHSRPRRIALVVGMAAIVGVGFGSAAILTARNPTRVAVHTNGPAAPSRATQGTSTTLAVGAEVPTTAQTTTTVAVPPHFDTPEAAMAYLAAAWNTGDIVSLRHVTNPAARAQLDAMHSEATNLRLNHCERRPQGDYTCYFDHDYPPGTPTVTSKAVGQAIFLVGPALTPGWYMTVFQSCG